MSLKLGDVVHIRARLVRMNTSRDGEAWLEWRTLGLEDWIFGVYIGKRTIYNGPVKGVAFEPKESKSVLLIAYNERLKPAYVLPGDMMPTI